MKDKTLDEFLNAVVEGYVNEAFNPYRELRNLIGQEDKESIINSVYSVTAIREWKCGCTLIRRVENDWRDGRYYLHDSYHPCNIHVELANKLREALKK